MASGYKLYVSHSALKSCSITSNYSYSYRCLLQLGKAIQKLFFVSSFAALAKD